MIHEPPGPDTPEPAPPGAMARLRSHLIDLEPLAVSRDYRLLFAGQAISELGSEITLVALPIQVYALTNSTLAVGLLGLSELFPLLLLSIVGGAVADATERRRLVLISQGVLATFSIVLAWNASLDDPLLWPLYVLSALLAGVWALAVPALRAWPVRLVGEKLLPSAFALEWSYSSLAMMIGPAVGGLLIGAIGFANAYLFDVGTFAVALVCVWLMRPSPPADDGPPFGIAAVKEGLRFLKGKRVLQSTYLVDLNAMIFGMPMALFPAVGQQLGGGPRLVGLLYAAPAAGSLAATMFSGRVKHVLRQGRAILIAVAVWGFAIVIFGFTSVTWVALAALAVAGAGDTISGIYRNTIAQSVVDDSMRGRIGGIGMAVWTTGPSLGNLESGAVASLVSVPFSIVSGGLACLAGVGLIAWLSPSFRRYDASDPYA